MFPHISIENQCGMWTHTECKHFFCSTHFHNILSFVLWFIFCWNGGHQWAVSNSASDLPKVWWKLIKGLNKHLVMTLWVRHKPTTYLNSLKFFWMSWNDDGCSRGPSTSTVLENAGKVHKAILEDHRQMIHEVCNIVQLSCGTWRILSDELSMRKMLQNSCQGCWGQGWWPEARLAGNL